MRAIVLRQTGGPDQLRLEELPDLEPGPGEVVVRLEAAALNHRDVWIRTGKYADIRLPAVLGSDGAGVVSAAGAGAAALMGRAVIVNPSLEWGTDPRAQGPGFRILGMPDPGTYAEYVRVPAANVVEMPAKLTFAEAAALPLAGLTAYRALVTRAELRPGESVLVTGIGGGVSTMALQLARQLGARVFVTSRSEAKVEAAVKLGAVAGVSTAAAGWQQRLVAANGGERFACVVDSVGGDLLGKVLEVVRPGGRVVTYGATAGVLEELNLRRVFWNQLSFLGSTMGTPDEFARLVRLYAEVDLRPVVDRVFPLAHAAQAHARMEQGEQLGKIVLVPRG